MSMFLLFVNARVSFDDAFSLRISLRDLQTVTVIFGYYFVFTNSNDRKYSRRISSFPAKVIKSYLTKQFLSRILLRD